MAECDSHNMYPNLNVIALGANMSNDQQFRLTKISEIKDYFIAQIRERELMSKNLNNYIDSFDYLDKALFVLSVATGRTSTATFATTIGAPLRIMSASCSLAFSITTGFFKKFLKITKNKKKKHNKIVMLARNKLNSIEIKISETLIINENGHEDFTTLLMKKKISRIKRKH